MTQITKVIGRVQLRGGTTANANSKNEVLLDRELFIEEGKGIKVGDGVTPYNGLNYAVDFTQTSLPEGGGNIEGTSYIFVQANGTPEENYQEFVDAYNEIKSRFPNPYQTPEDYGIILAPGRYKGDNLLINYLKMNIISLTGEPDVIFINKIDFSAPGIKVKGIKSMYKKQDSDYSGSFYTNSSSTERMVFINCIGGDGSFYSHHNGNKYINCVGGKQSFNTSGIKNEDNYYKDCEAKGADGFKSEQILYGTFENCIARDNSFIGRIAISYSTFKNCKAGNGSFKTRDGGGIIDTLFENCSAGDNSFWSEANLRAEFRNCVAGNNSFVGNNNEIEETALFYNCKAGNDSFKTIDGDNKGQFYNCIAGNDSFRGSTISGRFENCRGGNNSFGFKEKIEGTFVNCIAGLTSFGSWGDQGIEETALFLNCKADNYSFGHNNKKQKGTFIGCVAKYASFGKGSIIDHTANYFNCVCIGDYAGFVDTSGVALNCVVNNRIVV